MVHCFSSSNSFRGVALEENLEELKTLFVQSRNNLGKRLRFINSNVWLVERKVFHLRPLLVSGGTSDLENLVELVLLALSLEERLLVDEFSKDASNRPNVNRGRILLRSHQNVGSSVPKSHHFMSVVLDGDTECPSESEISKLENGVVGDEQVLRLEISVENSILMTMSNSIEKLIEVRFDDLHI